MQVIKAASSSGVCFGGAEPVWRSTRNALLPPSLILGSQTVGFAHYRQCKHYMHLIRLSAVMLDVLEHAKRIPVRCHMLIRTKC